MVVVWSALTATAWATDPSADVREARDEAERTSVAFQDDLEQHDRAARESVTAAVADPATTVQQVLAQAEETLATVPQLPAVPRQGRGSPAVADAETARIQVVNRWTEFVGGLKELIPSAALVDAGVALVALDPAELLEPARFPDGDDLRELVVPPFEQAVDDVEQVAPSRLDPALRDDLVSYGQFVISQTLTGADALDSFDTFSYALGDRPALLYQRLVVLDGTIARDLEVLLAVL